MKREKPNYRHDHGTKYGRGGSVSKNRAKENAKARASGVPEREIRKRGKKTPQEELESNDFRFQNDEETSQRDLFILRATMDAATRINTTDILEPSNRFSEGVYYKTPFRLFFLSDLSIEALNYVASVNEKVFMLIVNLKV